MLSVVITAWNEEKNLPRVVHSVKKLADEIVVVVDKASTDRTEAVAKQLGCKVFLHEHTGIVEPMRNFSISKAKGEWVLLLDADEEVSPGLAEHIVQLISKDQADFVRIPRKNIIFGKHITSSHWWPDYVYRLFKKGYLSWPETIHSVPATRGVGFDIPAVADASLIHYHYESISQYVDRLNRYTTHQLKTLQQEGRQFSWTDLISAPSQEFLRQYFSRGGYRDGIHGLALALLQAFSEAVLYLKLWQESGFKQSSVSLTQLGQSVTRQSRHWKWWYYQTRIDSAPFFLKPYWKTLRKISLIRKP